MNSLKITPPLARAVKKQKMSRADPSKWIDFVILNYVPDPHGQLRIRIQEVKKPRKCTGSLGENRTVRIKVRFL